MDFNRPIKTKTIKVIAPNFNKVRMKLKYHEIDFDYINDKEEVGGVRCRMAPNHDNESFVRAVLLRDNIDKNSVDDLMRFILTYLILDTKRIDASIFKTLNI
jgi:hypothetical protein